MLKFKITFLIPVFTLLILFIVPFNVLAKNSASGSLTVDGDTTEIKYAYADEFDGEITVALVDNEIPEGMFPDGVYNLGEQGKIKGIVFVVSSDDKKKLLKGGYYDLINAVHSHPKWNKLGTIGNGELTAVISDGDVYSGQIKTPSENEVDGHKFSYEIKFSVSLKKEPLKLTLTGKTDPPSQAFGEWGKALFAGDIEAYKKYSSQEILDMLPDDPAELNEGIEFQQLVFPTNIEILSTKIEGDKAVLKAKGTRGTEVSRGSIAMLKENGEWKVNKQSWESGSNAN